MQQNIAEFSHNMHNPPRPDQRREQKFSYFYIFKHNKTPHAPCYSQLSDSHKNILYFVKEKIEINFIMSEPGNFLNFMDQ